MEPLAYPPGSPSPSSANLDHGEGSSNDTSKSRSPGLGGDKGKSPDTGRNSNHRVLAKLSIPAEYNGWRRIVRSFTPSWFAVSMGTGIVSILLHKMPYNSQWLYWPSVILFAFNIIIFVLALAISILRYSLYPEIWAVMIRHQTQSLFIGAFPMALATIVNMVVFVCVPAWGDNAITLAYVLWWIDAVISVVVCFYLPFVIMHKHSGELSTMTAAWLLPVVPTIVAAASGGIVAEVLKSDDQVLWTVLSSYVLWGTGVPLAMAILVIYFHRLTIHKLPPREVIVSVFLPLGPLGQGGFAIMQLGKVSKIVFPKLQKLDPLAGEVLYVIGFMIALVMWGFGLVWLFFAVASITRSKKFPFNMGWWGFTFPIGVYAISTTTIGAELPSPFFEILGTVISTCVVILWFVVSVGTIHRVLRGDMFFAPCLKDIGQSQGDCATPQILSPPTSETQSPEELV